MARVITVLGVTIIFTILGLLIGYLNIRTNIEVAGGGSLIYADDLLISYVVAPSVAGLVGFVLAAIAMKLYGPSSP